MWYVVLSAVVVCISPFGSFISCASRVKWYVGRMSTGAANVPATSAMATTLQSIVGRAGVVQDVIPAAEVILRVILKVYPGAD